MTSEAQTNDKPDFSNYTWFPGVNDKFNAASVSVFEGRVFLGLKGYDKKQNGAGHIQAEFDYEQLSIPGPCASTPFRRPFISCSRSGRMALIDDLIALGGIGIVLLLILAFAVFVAPLGIWAALHRGAKAAESQAVAILDLAKAVQGLRHLAND